MCMSVNIRKESRQLLPLFVLGKTMSQRERESFALVGLKKIEERKMQDHQEAIN
ncbi:unnamed protein product [Camellia sinensis]